jgi:hypothetical protein
MNGYDVQSALEIAKRLTGIARRADMFNQDRARVLEEILFMAEDYAKLADRIEAAMVEELA